MSDSTAYVIAVVDDDFRILESLECLLESAGHSVRLFLSAEAFLESGTLGCINCLISDIGMPGIDGFRLERVVREKRPELPVFLITGREEVEHGSSLSGIPTDHFFRKPFDGRRLLMAVADAIRRSAS